MNLIKKLKQLCAPAQKQRNGIEAVQDAQWLESELKQIYRDIDRPKR